ncbi:hypothetical protein RhiirC2_803712, partial [Rhizophagus irregularis]
PNALDKFLANIYNPANNSQDIQEKPAEKKPEPVIEEQPVSKRAPPPLPPKPDHLKERLQELREEQPDPDEDTNESDTDEPIDNFSDCYLSDEKLNQEHELFAEDLVPKKPSAPEPDNYDILDDLLSDSDSTTADPILKQQPESPAESSAKSESFADSLASEQPIPEPDTEPEVDWDPKLKEGTQAHWAWQERHRWDRKLWVKNSKDQVFNDLYNTGKDLWAKYQDESD